MLDPYDTGDPVHLAYHQANRAAVRLGGQVRMRVRFREITTPWFDILWASSDELDALARQYGWHIAAIERDGFIYAAELRPTTGSRG